MPARESGRTGGGVAEAVRTRPKTAKPPRYVVVVFNDDFTPYEFVVEVLQRVFRMDTQAAIATMMAIHRRGAAPCGTYPRDVAETKAAEVAELAKAAGHPLKAGVEKE